MFMRAMKYGAIQCNQRGCTEVCLEIHDVELVLRGQGRHNQGKRKRES